MTLVREEWKIARFEGEECRWRVLSLDLICEQEVMSNRGHSCLNRLASI